MQGNGINTDTDTIFWFRRDLRLNNNTALSQALLKGKKVQAIFIFDPNFLEGLTRTDRRISFLYEQLLRLHKQLLTFGSSLRVYHAQPKEVFQNIKTDYPSLSEVHWNRDYTPYARHRDEEIVTVLKPIGVTSYSYKDHVLLEPEEVLKSDGTPYTVFTPYAKKWRMVFDQSKLTVFSIGGLEGNFVNSNHAFPTLPSLGFEKVDFCVNTELPETDLLQEYAEKRDFPSQNSTSKTSVALRFGIISIRDLYWRAQKFSESFVTELIWREFYQMILWHFPHTVTKEFKPKYAAIPWRNDPKDFERWKNGDTGVALVDAGMRELNNTGLMHNRVRMVVASFLCKNLMIDWRWGEAYFAEKLLDYELASNVGGWQWAASCGCDAAPYFRVFNPVAQAKKFDPKSEYIRRWVPEFENESYQPMVDIKQSRKTCIEIYKTNLNKIV